MKSYTDIEQSRKLAEILQLKSADMTLPFTRKENNEYIPRRVVSRNYIDVYNDMFLLPAMDKSTISKLIQPCWSLAALLDILPKYIEGSNRLRIDINNVDFSIWYDDLRGYGVNDELPDIISKEPVDACVEMILKLNEENLL